MNYQLKILANNDVSPLENHTSTLEFAVDTDNRTFYAFDNFVVTYGIDSLNKACQDYCDAKGWNNVMIGPRSVPNEVIIKKLQKEQDKGKPSWWDGMFVYTVGSKLEYVDGKLKKVHNLSEYGFFNHFQACEYTSYNQICDDHQKELEKIEKEKQRIIKEKEEEEYKIEQAKRDKEGGFAKELTEYFDSLKIRGKKTDFVIVSGDKTKEFPVSGTVYGNLAIHKRTKEDSGLWAVALPKAGGNITHFRTKKSAVTFVKAISELSNWDFDNADDIPSELVRKIKETFDFLGGSNFYVENLKKTYIKD